MNTFAFTDDEIEVIKSSLEISADTICETGDYAKESIYRKLISRLNRKPSHIIGECGGPEISRDGIKAKDIHTLPPKAINKILDKLEVVMTSDNRAVFQARPKEK